MSRLDPRNALLLATFVAIGVSVAPAAFAATPKPTAVATPSPSPRPSATPSGSPVATTPGDQRPNVIDETGVFDGVDLAAVRDMLARIRTASDVRIVIATNRLPDGAEPPADFDLPLFLSLQAQAATPPDLLLIYVSYDDDECPTWTNLRWDGSVIDEAMAPPYSDHLLSMLASGTGCPDFFTFEDALRDLGGQLGVMLGGDPHPTFSRPSLAPGSSEGTGPIGGGPDVPRITSPPSIFFLIVVLAGPLVAIGSWLRFRRTPLLTFQRQQQANRSKSFAMVLVLIAVLAGLGYVIGFAFTFDAGPSSLAGLVLAALGLIAAPIAYRFGDGMTLAAAGAVRVDPGSTDPTATTLNNVVSEMAIAANLPRPSVYLIETSVPNAMATGRNPAHASIAVTRGLVDRLDREELQGVIAHEMSHIRNLDVRYAMLVAVLVGTIVLITDLFFQGTLRMILNGSWARVRGKNALQAALAFLAFLLFLLLVATILRLFAPLAALGVQAAVSRQREFLADATAVDLGRNPVSLEKALAKIAAADDRMTDANRAITHLYFVHPTFSEADARREGSAAGWRGIFSTHPSILDRVNRLRALAGEEPLVGSEADQLAVEA